MAKILREATTATELPTDFALLQRMRDGDQVALDTLLKRHWDAVFSYARHLCQDHDSANDIAQRSFIRIWERRREWQPVGEVRAFLFRIARNLALNEQRGQRVRMSEVARNLARRFLRVPTPLEELEGLELGQAFERALRSLPARRREVFVLARFHDLTYAEIARVLDISPQTVANQMSAALRHLQSCLAPYL